MWQHTAICLGCFYVVTVGWRTLSGSLIRLLSSPIPIVVLRTGGFCSIAVPLAPECAWKIV